MVVGRSERRDTSGAGAPGTTLLRADLVQRLADRFERRLTVVRAGAGFGKSTLLAQARDEARIERLGDDVMVRLDDRDRDAPRLRRHLAAALDVTGEDPTVDDLLEAVWTRAPTPVALVLDDVHVIDGAPEAWAVVRRLLEQLPANGHLVVSGRRAPDLPVARLQARGEVLLIEERDLAFDADDLQALAELRGLDPAVAAELPTWPALATLTGVVGHQASLEYLWDEVLGALPEQRRALLAAVAPFGEVDDELVLAVGGEGTAVRLVDGLPLVDVDEDGTCRLHDLWRGALADVLAADDRRRAMGDVGRHLLGRGDLGRAAEAFALAGDADGARQVVLAFASRPTLRPNVPVIDRLRQALGPLVGDEPVGRYLEAARFAAADDRQSAELFRRVAATAQAAGDHELEVLARWRVVQFEDLERIGGPPPTPRLAELAAQGVPRASAVLAFLDSRRAQLAGDPEAALQALAGLDGFGADQRASSLGIRLIDLGRPEALPATLDAVLASGIDDINDALAVWFQGAIDPVAAWPLARELVGRAEAMPVLSRVSLLSVLATMATAAGELVEARALADEALRLAPASARTVRLLAEVASALVALAADGEAVAVRALVDLLDEVPLGRWPERPYLYGLCVLRGLVPGTDGLDDCAFGPSLAVAVAAGSAVAALRAGDRRPAAALPWHRPALLRVHVPGPLLVELALAAGGVPGADAAIEGLPHLRTWAQRAQERHPGPIADRARAVLVGLPARPAYDLRIELLGGCRLGRSDGGSVAGWDRRERVRQLLALLAVERDLPRAEVAARLWPDLPADKAAANLRVNLHHLQRALQPERGPDEPPWFVRADGDRLQLVADGVAVDHEELGRAMAEAVRAEAEGLGSRALDRYRRVDDLYRGDLLPEATGDWVEVERIRLRSLALAAATRCGELELARGEPEEAMRLAARAQHLDPLSERAQRLFVRSHLALGSRGAARQAAERLLALLDREGMAPEPETLALVARLS